jgi:hypothetical protein
MSIIFSLESPKDITRGAWFASKSAARRLYSSPERLAELIAITPDPRPYAQLDFTHDAGKQRLHGRFTLASRPAFKVLAKHLPKLICTYAIEHESGAAYVGSTDDFFLRWRRHLQLLRANGHKNKLLQDIFNLDGAGAFTIRIVRQYDTEDGLLAHEVEDSLGFKELLNVRIGSQYVEGWEQHCNRRTERYQPQAKRGRQTKARWYDGQGPNA